MSREPSSPLHRSWQYHEKAEPPPPPPTQPKAGPPKRVPRVRVENAGRDEAIEKLLTTTEKLTVEERRIVQGFRLSKGGPKADAERRRIEQRIREENR